MNENTHYWESRTYELRLLNPKRVSLNEAGVAKGYEVIDVFKQIEVTGEEFTDYDIYVISVYNSYADGFDLVTSVTKDKVKEFGDKAEEADTAIKGVNSVLEDCNEKLRKQWRRVDNARESVEDLNDLMDDARDAVDDAIFYYDDAGDLYDRNKNHIDSLGWEGSLSFIAVGVAAGIVTGEPLAIIAGLTAYLIWAWWPEH